MKFHSRLNEPSGESNLKESSNITNSVVEQAFIRLSIHCMTKNIANSGQCGANLWFTLNWRLLACGSQPIRQWGNVTSQLCWNVILYGTLSNQRFHGHYIFSLSKFLDDKGTYWTDWNNLRYSTKYKLFDINLLFICIDHELSLPSSLPKLHNSLCNRSPGVQAKAK